MKNISMLSSMNMINHYSLIVSTNSYNICYLSWLVMAREPARAGSFYNELAHYKTSRARTELLTNESSELASFEFFAQP